MADKTKIEWTDATWSPVTGCTKVSPGCDHCYAETVTNRFKRHPFEEVQLHPDRLSIPAKWQSPRKIFVCSMGDLFHSGVPWDFIIEVFNQMEACPQHIFQVLTKRPGRMAHFANWIRPDAYNSNAPYWPENVWAGTSVESQKYAPRLDVLARVPAKVRFVSYEPALGPVDFRRWLGCEFCAGNPDRDILCGCGNLVNPDDSRDLHWVIAGGESGPGARPAHPDWFRAVRDQCQAAGVPFFFKQWGHWADPVGLPISDVTKWAFLDASGEPLPKTAPLSTPGAAFVAPLGKKAAGGLLDGVQHHGFPSRPGLVTS